MRFVSIVGTQVMAVINPLLALRRAGIPVDMVRLLVTRKTKGIGERIVEYLVSDAGIPAAAILPLELVSDLAERSDGEWRSIGDVIGEMVAERRPWLFNLAGAKKVLITEAQIAVGDSDWGFLYPERNGLFIFRMAGGKFQEKRLRNPPELPVERLLELQGVLFRKMSCRKTQPEWLSRAIYQCGNSYPMVQMHSVRIQEIEFDLVWNRGNVLNYLVGFEPSGKREADLPRIRDLILLANSRDRMGDLFERNVWVALENRSRAANRTAFNRLVLEGGGKIHPIVVGEKEGEGGASLERVFLGQGGTIGTERVTGKTTVMPGGGTTSQGIAELHLVLGRNPDPSLGLLWSLRPSLAVLYATPDDPEVEKARKAIASRASTIPVGRLRFVPIDFLGRAIFDGSESMTSGAVVNITPGTKSQAFFLGAAALRAGASISRLGILPGNGGESVRGVVVTYGSRKVVEALSPPPAEYLRLCGFELRAGRSAEALNANLWGEVGDFLRRAKEAGIRIPEKPWHSMTLPDGSRWRGKVRVAPGKNDDHDVTFDGREKGRTHTFALRNGLWLEDFVAYLVLRSGGEDVRIGVKVDWPDPRDGDHMSEIDVLARFRSTCYAIECKSGDPLKTSGAQKRGFRAVVTRFGRFAVPMICMYQRNGPPSISNRMAVFGRETLADREGFPRLLAAASRMHRGEDYDFPEWPA